MKFPIDHDLHLHSTLSRCCRDADMTPQCLLDYAAQNNYRALCLTDHLWDCAIPGACDWYRTQDLAHIKAALPLPQAPHTRFLFGAEAEMDRNLRLGLRAAAWDILDFVAVSTTHLHFKGFTVPAGTLNAAACAALWEKRLSALLSMRLPFHKIGIAHLTTPLLCPDGDHREALSLVPDETMQALFSKAARLGAAVELNARSIIDDAQVLRPYRVAKKAGCRFYLGSDAHDLKALQRAPADFERIVDLLGLGSGDCREL